MKTTLLLLGLSSVIFTTAFAQKTYIPDDKFEQKLIDQGYDSGVLDDSVMTSMISSLDTLDIKLSDISDLTGIEDFVNLKVIRASFNNLSSVDLSNNILLEDIEFSFNDLISIDLNSNMALRRIKLDHNELTDLDLSQNTNIFGLDVAYNVLESLYINSTELLYLNCRDNNITNLDMSDFPLLKNLICADNELIEVDLRNGNNTNLDWLIADMNPNLFCIDVESPAYSSANWMSQYSTSYYYDDQIEFSTDCSTIGLEENDIENIIDVFYSTDNKIINIESMSNASYKLYSTEGKALLMNGKLTEGHNQINLSTLSNGLYFIEVTTDIGIIVREKICK